MRRTILLSALIFVGCTYFHRMSTCPGSAAPIVCIDAALNASPDPVHVKRGQWLHFFIARGDLNIESDILEIRGTTEGKRGVASRRTPAMAVTNTRSSI